MPTKISLVGRTFGNWIVIDDASVHRMPCGITRRRSQVRCLLCDDIHVVFNASLTAGTSRQCRKCADAFNVKHGLSRTRAYRSWIVMLERTENPARVNFELWGGRGIRVCQRFHSFPDFFADLGACPLDKGIDRWPNNETGHYSCGKCAECVANGWLFNVRWATQKEQSRNTRRNIIVTVQGVTGCVTELCEHFQIEPKRVQRVLYRIRHGWPAELAMFAPKGFCPNGSGQFRQGGHRDVNHA